ncbi:glycosyltransferase family 39 protein [archaeon]|nr:glycosyltransferase family 39 protein [archaeon]
MKDQRKILLIFIASLILFSTPVLVRWQVYGNPSYIGTPTFMHARISQYMIEGKFNWYDPLSYGGRLYTYPPLFSICLALLGILIGLGAASIVYAPIFGAVGVVFFYLIAKLYLKNHALLASVIMMLIPVTIFLNSHISTRAPGVALGLAAMYIIMRKQNIMRKQKAGKPDILYSGVLLGISFLFHPESAIIFLVVIFIYMFCKNNAKNFLKIAAISIIIALVWYGPFLASNGLPGKSLIYDEYRDQRYSLESPTLGNYFLEIDHAGMLSLLVAAFCVLGFIVKKDNFMRYWIIFAFLLTLAFERFFIYMPFPLAILAVFGLEYARKKLNKKMFSALLIIFLAYTAFFGFVKVAAFANDYPTIQQYDALMWLKENTPENETILSGWQFGHWISGISERKNFMDGYAEYAPNVDERLKKLHDFYSDCKIPEGYGIHYVYMEDWFVKEMNITCLSKFQPVYDNNYIYVYKFS